MALSTFFMKKYRNTTYRRTENWNKKVDDFNHRMNECAFDIRTKDQVYQNRIESIYGPKKTDEDEQFYLDNCSGPCPSSEASCSFVA